jgi:putative endonuclease
MVASEDRRRRLGARGERLAKLHLEAAGYTIVDRNFRTRHGELDLIAWRERVLVFCEVKTRTVAAAGGCFGPFASIGGTKRRRLRLMASRWLAERGVPTPGPVRELRFDAIGVETAPDGRLVRLDHLEGAF